MVSAEPEQSGAGTDIPDRDESDRIGGAMHVIEISDADYRSFCLPCNALDENGDCARDH
jgi:hypothetical protein